MRKVYNFSSGPAMLPEEVLREAQTELLDWHQTGMSIMEVGHRGRAFQSIVEQTEADLRELMDIPDNYHLLFLTGGATAQFSMVPMNLFAKKNHADYIDTGIWSKKALTEAMRFGQVNIAAQIEYQEGLACIPKEEKWSLNPDAAYVHYTPNETIEGIEFNSTPKTGQVPLVADMSSSILSQPINVRDFGIIYAGAQKNLGQAGISLVIIRDDLVHEPAIPTPILYSYKLHIDNKSLYNTPPTFAWYILGLTVAWVKRQGGVKTFAEINQHKAQTLYHFIDSHHEFYNNTVHPDCRSRMNVPFNLSQVNLTETFLQAAEKEGLTNLKGHRLAGGVRASLYNAMPQQGVDKLIEFMKDFARTHG